MNLKRMVGSMLVVVGVLSAGAAAYAATATSPAEVVANLTGQTVEAVTVQRAAGVTYGKIAADANLLPEFQQQMLQLKKDALEQRVKDGQLTALQADEILKAIEENQATCDGSGTAKIGQKLGAKFGHGNGFGRGNGNGAGQGLGGGMRRQTRLGNGGGLGKGRVR